MPCQCVRRTQIVCICACNSAVSRPTHQHHTPCVLTSAYPKPLRPATRGREPPKFKHALLLRHLIPQCLGALTSVAEAPRVTDVRHAWLQGHSRSDVWGSTAEGHDNNAVLGAHALDHLDRRVDAKKLSGNSMPRVSAEHCTPNASDGC
eukprot:3053446-Rhodomonas_salina.4